MAVFTILNCGTNFDRYKRGELIADFGAEMAGTEYEQYLITDGVGAKGSKSNPLPGTFDPFTKNKSLKKDTPGWSQTPMQTLTDVTKARGLLAHRPWLSARRHFQYGQHLCRGDGRRVG